MKKNITYLSDTSLEKVAGGRADVTKVAGSKAFVDIAWKSYVAIFPILPKTAAAHFLTHVDPKPGTF